MVKADHHVLNAEETINIEETITDASGHTKIMLTNKRPLRDAKNKIIGIVGTSTNITLRKSMEKELLVAKNIAEASEKVKTEFIANMSHDVKTPLTGIIGLSEILTNKLKHSPDVELIKLMQGAGNQLLHFFENCLEMAKLESGGLTLVEQYFDPCQMVDELKELFTPSALKKGIHLIMEYASKIPHKVYGSHAGFYRILLNLLGNALKFTNKGSVEVYLSLDENQNSEKVVLNLQVQDTGIGIPANKIDRIFERFSRVTPSYTGKYEGSGIGLYIVKKYVTEMHGKISVTSQLGKGSRFDVQIPFLLEKSDKNLSDTQSFFNRNSNSEATISISPSKLKVLLVEPDLSTQSMVQTWLNALGYEVDVADSATCALKQFEPLKYHIIFMDLELPDLNGTIVTRHIRKIETGVKAHVPIVALGEHVTDSSLKRCLEAGMDSVLNKPLTQEVVETTLKNIS
ncbi:MAG: ATP-binding protein [Gammaproteobacteria bacterium]